MLPDCFYIPPEGEPRKPQEEDIDCMNLVLVSIKASAEYLMDDFYEVERYKPQYNDWKYPFRKFEVPVQSFVQAMFVDHMLYILRHIKDAPWLDAFRLAVRYFAMDDRRENLIDFLHYILHYADTPIEAGQQGNGPV
eukprot:scaffold30309_cov58-Attheya_sp.AAC.5